MYIIILTAIILIAVWAVEYRRHLRNLNCIPVRIHVNGTRGKSSVTRLIAAGLRAGGMKTLAKTTGTLPRIIDEEGLEIPVPRPYMVNIIEQLKIVDFMRKRSPQAIVIECMAVQPEYQWICEHKMIRSTIGVITNSRLDHIREMGPAIENITLSLCNTLPKGGTAFTSERKMLPMMEKAAARTNTKLIASNGVMVTAREMAGFDHVEHPDNVSLALAVCQHLNIDRETALMGMYQSHPDAGAMKIFKVVNESRRVFFINALAANDPDSTLEIWTRVQEMYPQRDYVTVLLNSRADRFDRSLQLVEMCRKSIRFDKLTLIGEKTEQVQAFAVRIGVQKNKIVSLKTRRAEDVYNRLMESAPDNALSIIFAIGNMGAGGLQVAASFHKHSAATIERVDEAKVNQAL